MDDRLSLEVRRGPSMLRVHVEGTGDPMVYLHGLTGTGAVVRAEAPAGFRLATFDQRGHGDATAFTSPDDYALAEFIADLEAVVAALRWEQFTLAGVSMGATVALGYAIRNPDRVRTLVLVAPSLLDRPNAAIPLFDLWADTLEREGVVGLLSTLGEQAAGLQQLDNPYIEAWRRHEPLAMATALRTVGRWSPYPHLSGLRVQPPVKVLAWKGDPMHPFDLAERAAAALSGELSALPGIAEVVADPAIVRDALLHVLEHRDRSRTAVNQRASWDEPDDPALD